MNKMLLFIRWHKCKLQTDFFFSFWNCQKDLQLMQMRWLEEQHYLSNQNPPDSWNLTFLVPTIIQKFLLRLIAKIWARSSDTTSFTCSKIQALNCLKLFLVSIFQFQLNFEWYFRSNNTQIKYFKPLYDFWQKNQSKIENTKKGRSFL